MLGYTRPMGRFGALIDGRWVPAGEVGREHATVRAPWDGAPLGEVALAEPAIVERAIASAATTFERQRRDPYPLHERLQVLERLARRLAEEREPIARTISAEAGKPITQARVEVDRAIATVNDSATAAKAVLGGEVLALATSPTSADRLGIDRRFSLGVVSAITPFNFPLNLAMHKVAPAIAAGCPVVLKPAPQAPLTAFRLADLCVEAGLRPGSLQLVYCDNATAAPLIEDPRIAMLSFTGSARAGRALQARAGRKRVTLELGGNGAVIVDECADLGAAATRIAAAANAYAGQTCISVQRVLVRRALLESLREALREAIATLAVGDPAADTTVVGPVIDDAAASRIESWVGSAVGAGARRHGALERSGRLLRPILLEDVPLDQPVVREEVFGPVATLEPYDDFDDAIDRVNASPFGLQAGVYVRDVGRLFRAFDRLQVGGVIHDDCPTFRVDAMPYGGTKESGQGREGPRYAIEEMTEHRVLVMRLPGTAG
jgi:acyl-CoA reductase-like NAD-dependent aldehyde dehydrogenase